MTSSKMSLPINYKRILRLSLLILSSLFVLFVGGFYLTSTLILPSERLTPLILNLANDNFNATLHAEQIELTLWSTFPNIGLEIRNGSLVSTNSRNAATPTDTTLTFASDSLMNFRYARASILPFQFLFNNQIAIPEVTIDTLSVFAHLNKDGKANWEIVKPDTTDSAIESELLKIDLRSLRINHADIVYNSDPDTTLLHLSDANIYFRGGIGDSISTLYTDLSIGRSYVCVKADEVVSSQRVGIKADLVINNNLSRFHLRDAQIFINGLALDMNGSMTKVDKSKSIYNTDIEMTLATAELNEFLKIIPHTRVDLSNFDTYGEANVGGRIEGLFGEGNLPTLRIGCTINKGRMLMKNYNNVDSLELDFQLFIDPGKKEPSFINLSKLYIKSQTSFLNLSAEINDLLGNQAVEGSMVSDLNFDAISSFFDQDSITLKGKLATNLKVKFTADDLRRANYGNIHASGDLCAERILIRTADSITFRLKHGDLDLVSEQIKGAEPKAKREHQLSGVASLDSLNIQLKNAEAMRIGNLTAHLKTSPFRNRKDTSAIVPLQANVQLRNYSLSMTDSMALFSRLVKATLAFKPSAKSSLIPTLEATFDTDTLVSRYATYSIFTDRFRSKVSATHYEPDSITRQRIETTRQARISRRDTTTVARQSRLGNNTLEKLLRRWDGSMIVTLNTLRTRSTQLPFPLEVSNLRLESTTNNIRLVSGLLQMGRSDFALTGDIVSLRGTLLRNRKLNAKLNVISDSIDLNQLIPALTVAFNQQPESESNPYHRQKIQIKEFDEAQLANTLDSMQHISVDTETLAVDTTIFTVPDFINLELKTKAKWIGYGNGHLSKVNGTVNIQNANIEVSNLSMDSEFGLGNLTLLYSPINTTTAFTGFDLSLEHVEVKKLLDLYPPIDTIIPMLRSFEGIVTCQIAATAELDAALNIKLPSLNAACFMHGDNLVLLDGETFAEISKKLMFKNKKRNMIDSISVEVMIRDNKIEIFPFIVEMDRYRAAIAGVQNLDMSFNYHIAVLKSPVPFKLGIDVNGNVDKWNYKITRPKLKESNIASQRTLIDSTQINVRRGIQEQLKRSNAGLRPLIIQALPPQLDTLTRNLVNMLDSVAEPHDTTAVVRLEEISN